MSNALAERFAEALLKEFSHEGKFDCSVDSEAEGERLMAAFIARGCRAEMNVSKLVVRVTCPPPRAP